MNNFGSRAVISGAFIGALLLSACTDFSVPPLGLNNQTPKDGFGAIAFSTTTQRWHIRWNVSDQDSADALATQYCGAEDCEVVLQFGPGQCGTFSLGSGGALGTGRGDTENAAESTARANCELSGQSCKVAPTRCNSQS